MKELRYFVVAIIIGVVVWNSVYFKKLDEVKASQGAGGFNAEKYADNFWNSKLMPATNNAIDISQLTTLLKNDEAKAFEDHSHALGIGNLRYFLIKGTSVVDSVLEDKIVVLINDQKLFLATELIFGNAVRDATGLININEFVNTMDFNNVSAEINKIIRETVLPSFKGKVKKGDKIEFVGAIELNREHVETKDIEVIPVKIQI